MQPAWHPSRACCVDVPRCRSFPIKCCLCNHIIERHSPPYRKLCEYLQRRLLNYSNWLNHCRERLRSQRISGWNKRERARSSTGCWVEIWELLASTSQLVSSTVSNFHVFLCRNTWYTFYRQWCCCIARVIKLPHDYESRLLRCKNGMLQFHIPPL